MVPSIAAKPYAVTRRSPLTRRWTPGSIRSSQCATEVIARTYGAPMAVFRGRSIDRVTGSIERYYPQSATSDLYQLFKEARLGGYCLFRAHRSGHPPVEIGAYSGRDGIEYNFGTMAEVYPEHWKRSFHSEREEGRLRAPHPLASTCGWDQGSPASVGMIEAGPES